jgi:hypothetical protein
VSEVGTDVAFGVLVAVALALMTYMLWRQAQELGHAPGRARGRLLILWVAVGAAVALGLFLRRVFPEGLFQINFTHAYSTPWFTLSGGSSGLFLAAGLLGMALCAAVALWAINSLQRPLLNHGGSGVSPDEGGASADQVTDRRPDLPEEPADGSGSAP